MRIQGRVGFSTKPLVSGAGRLCGLLLVVISFLGVVSPEQASAIGDAARGRIVFALAAGCGCHTSAEGPVGAGGGEVETPFGKFYGPNITPDQTTGIGGWTDAEVDAAIRNGITRSGSAESAAMPYPAYAGMTDEDVADLTAFLRSLPAVLRVNRRAEGELPMAHVAYRVWRWLFFRPGPRLVRAPTMGIERGRYLVDHVSLCADCHTPRTRLGVADGARYLAGAAHGPGGDPVPNITPHKTGIDDWDIDDIVNILTYGRLPDFDNVQGAMAEVVDGHAGGPGYKDAPAGDRRAIAEYLKTIPPIDNKIEDK